MPRCHDSFCASAPDIASPSPYTDGCSAGQRGLLLSSLSLCWHWRPWLRFVWSDDVLIERWWVGGKPWGSLAQPTNREATRGSLRRETHKLEGVVVLIETSCYNMMCIHLRLSLIKGGSLFSICCMWLLLVFLFVAVKQGRSIFAIVAMFMFGPALKRYSVIKCNCMLCF